MSSEHLLKIRSLSAEIEQATLHGKGANMKKTSGAMFIVLVWLVLGSNLGFATAGTTLFNDTGAVVFGLRVYFDSPVSITDMGDGFTSWVSEENGATVQFTDGQIDIWEDFYLLWEPTNAQLIGHEWLTETPEITLCPGDPVKIPAMPRLGFQWAYYLRILSSAENKKNAGEQVYLLVLPNNTGQSHDDYVVHDEAALRMARGGSGVSIARHLGLVLLVPSFPRPRKDWRVYTHTLDRDCLTTSISALERLDLQLEAMIDDAILRLTQDGWEVEDKVLMMGFSASGMFTNRFTVLHPDRVLAAAIGSPGGWPIASTGEWGESTLRYPIGVHDIKQLVGKPFDLGTYKQVPQYLYIGDEDTNDSVPFDDGYEDRDETLIFRLFGETPVARWPIAQEIYETIGANSTFRLYSGVGHRVTPIMERDIRVFFSQILE